MNSGIFCRYHRIRSPVINFWRLYQKEHLSLKANNGPPEKLSPLFVPKRYGGAVYQIVKPRLDVQFIEESFSEIERSIRRRNIELDLINQIPLLKEWADAKVEYSNLIKKDKEYMEETKRCKSEKLTAELEKVIQEHNEFCENSLRSQKGKLYDMEDVVIPIFQVIPNTISKHTPDEDEVEKSFGTLTEGNLASHVEVGKRMGMLELSDVSPSAYYLMGKFSELEMNIQDYFFNSMLDLGFSPMSCTDFCKSFIIEAIGMDSHSIDDCIPLQPKEKEKQNVQKLNLVGGSSFASFCGYLTNMNISKSSLPFSYFSLGRCYTAKHRNVTSHDLFSVVQSTNIQLVVLSEDENDSKFDDLFKTLESMYEAIGIPFRTVNVGAVNLNVTERRKKQIELWSPSYQKFIPVSWLSSRGDFVSKRLSITHGEEYTVDGFCYIIEGVGVNVPVLIGCIVENLQNSNNGFDFPKIFYS